MSTEHESMMGILKLYELRSEATMRKARDWFALSFHPESAQDILQVLVGEHSADFRMVASYWDMASAFVVLGAINEEMFNAINTEHVAVYAKLQPFLAELRAVPGIPPYLFLKHLEPVVQRIPDYQERVAAMRRYMKSRRELQAAAQKYQMDERRRRFMELGNFSVSLAVKDIEASKAFYEKLGFTVFMGNQSQGWLILKNGDHVIGLFQGMFDKNVLTFNPGWDNNGQPLAAFTDVRELQRQLKASGVNMITEADENSTGPASFMIADPDGNTILVDQHV